MTRALVLAGGGVIGIAWESGVLAGLEAGGFDTQHWDLVVGTSAGAYVGARLIGDGSPGPLFTVQTAADDAAYESELRVLFGAGFMRTVRLSRRSAMRWVGFVWLMTFVATSLMRYAIRHGLRAMPSLLSTVRRGPGSDPRAFLAQIGALATTSRSDPMLLIDHWQHALGGDRGWPTTRLIMTAIDTRDGSRMLFDAASGVSLLAAIAASTCLPGLLAPIRLRGRRYMDGGIASPTNADVAAGHQEVWIVSPAGSGVLDLEIAALRSSGSRVHLIRPGAASERALPSGLAAFDPRHRLRAARAGHADGQAAARAAAS